MKKSHIDSFFVLLNTLSTLLKEMGHNNTSKTLNTYINEKLKF